MPKDQNHGLLWGGALGEGEDTDSLPFGLARRTSLPRQPLHTDREHGVLAATKLGLIRNRIHSLSFVNYMMSCRDGCITPFFTGP